MAGNDWRQFVLLALVGGALAFGLYLVHATAAGLAILGLWLGEFLAESARLQNTAAVWPMMANIVDWSRVERAITDGRLD